MKNPEKYECGSLRVKVSECWRSYTQKKKKYNSKFQADWMKDFQFLRPSLGNESSFCTLCSVNFSDVGTFWGEMCDIKELFSK
jgi:hypothetical protein